MYDFRITPDDQGVQRLRNATRERGPTEAVAPPAPSRAVGDQPQAPPRQMREQQMARRGQDRRRGERRRARQAVMLDTRSPHDRRRGEQGPASAPLSRGIDVFA